MEYTLKISRVAHDDIQSLYNYVKKDGDGVAKKQVEYIYEAIQKIQYNPNIGKKLSNFISQPTNYRYIIIKNVYIAFYLVSDYEIQVSRILSTKQDDLNILDLK